MLTLWEVFVSVVFVVITLIIGEILGEIKAKEQIINTLLERIPNDADLLRRLQDLQKTENSVL